MRKIFLIAIILCFLFLFAAIVKFLIPGSSKGPVFCTTEALICPDGSAVGRSGPNCEFASCPDPYVGWKDFTGGTQGITFRYPEQLLATKYIHAVDWPPQVVVADGPFICTGGGSEIAQAGLTKQQTINGRVYCVTKESEGAAGSVYTNYAYAFSKNDKVVIMTFSLRSVQCANYDDPQKTECENERQTFESGGVVDSTIDLMAQSTVIE